MFLIFGLLYVPTNLVIFIYKKELREYNATLNLAVIYVRALSMLIVSLYIFPAFMSHFKFFVQMKAEKLIVMR